MNHHQVLTLPVVLTIGGFDPSSGAGITADLKTIAAENCYGVAAITALTVQNTQGVMSLQAVKAALALETTQTLLAEGCVKAIKIGMLANSANAKVLGEILAA